MKWFKHMSSASDDEFLDGIIDDFGLEGYARWWLILEAIASQMDGSNKCSVTYSWGKWQSILRGKRNKLGTFLERLENESKINLKQTGNKLEIECPKLLKLRDNYTKDLEEVLEQPLEVTSKQEVEVEVDKELLVTGDASDSPEEVSQDDEQDKKTLDKIPDCPHQDIIDLYHERCPSFRPVVIWNDTRRAKLRTRWRENPKHRDMKFWVKYFDYAQTSKFLTGDSQRGWIADLEFLVTANKFTKILEGQYHQ